MKNFTYVLITIVSFVLILFTNCKKQEISIADTVDLTFFSEPVSELEVGSLKITEDLTVDEYLKTVNNDSLSVNNTRNCMNGFHNFGFTCYQAQGNKDTFLKKAHIDRLNEIVSLQRGMTSLPTNVNSNEGLVVYLYSNLENIQEPNRLDRITVEQSSNKPDVGSSCSFWLRENSFLKSSNIILNPTIPGTPTADAGDILEITDNNNGSSITTYALVLETGTTPLIVVRKNSGKIVVARWLTSNTNNGNYQIFLYKPSINFQFGNGSANAQLGSFKHKGLEWKTSNAKIFQNGVVQEHFSYNELAANYTLPQGPCPDGWRLPTQNEWEVLLGDYGWATPGLLRGGWTYNYVGELVSSPHGTNSTGFSVDYTGWVDPKNHFQNSLGVFWSSDGELDNNGYWYDKSWGASISFHESPTGGVFANISDDYAQNKYSCRCVRKDLQTQISKKLVEVDLVNVIENSNGNDITNTIKDNIDFINSKFIDYSNNRSVEFQVRATHSIDLSRVFDPSIKSILNTMISNHDLPSTRTMDLNINYIGDLSSRITELKNAQTDKSVTRNITDYWFYAIDKHLSLNKGMNTLVIYLLPHSFKALQNSYTRHSSILSSNINYIYLDDKNDDWDNVLDLIHEIGHMLNLRHIFYDKKNPSGQANCDSIKRTTLSGNQVIGDVPYFFGNRSKESVNLCNTGVATLNNNHMSYGYLLGIQCTFSNEQVKEMNDAARGGVPWLQMW